MGTDSGLKRFVVGEVSTNAYLLADRYLIDPGGWSRELERALKEAGEDLKAVLLTHAHYDHIGGIPELRERRPDCPIYCHSREAPALEDPEQNMSAWSGAPLSLAAEAHLGEVDLVVNEEPLTVLETPGHTPGSVSFHWAARKLVFAGDALFRRGIGRTDLPGGDHRQLLESIRDRLLTLDPDTRVFPGHGEPTTVGEERDENPYLKDR